MKAEPARWACLTPAEVSTLVRAVVRQVVMRHDQVDIELSPARLRDALHAGPGSLPAVVGETCGDGVILSQLPGARGPR